MPDSHGSIDLGGLSTEEQEAVAAIAAEHDVDPDNPNVPGNPAEVLQVVTAMTVVITPEGQTMPVPVGTPIHAIRPPTTDDLYSMGAVLQKDALVQETSQATAQTLMMQAQQAQQAMQAQQMAQSLQQSGKLRG